MSLLGQVFRATANRGFLRNVWYPRYTLQFSPRQLKLLLGCLDDTADVDGAVVEIGCAYGVTTTFLYEYLEESGIDKRYVCIDTFSGFTGADIEFERTQRGKTHSYEAMFKRNRAAWFTESLARRRITDVVVIQADICEMDADRLPDKVAFCLIDVDLYRPVKVGIEKVWPRLSPGGMIVVDDCWTREDQSTIARHADEFDGAMSAYREFVAGHGLIEDFTEGKLGRIRKSDVGAGALTS